MGKDDWASTKIQAHNIGGRQKTNRRGCTCTLGEVQSGKEEGNVARVRRHEISPDNFQRFIDQHAALFAAIFPVYFISLWLLVAVIISYTGGWHSLSKIYRTQVPFHGAKWGGQSGQMRRMTNYNRVLTIGASQEGLYLACMFLFRFMHPPLLIPWNEIKVRRKKGWVFDYVILTLGHELMIPLRIRLKFAERLRNEAGRSWPVE